jgi:hypothetical protein
MVKRDVGATWKQMMENGRQGAPIQCHRMDPDQTTLWTRIGREGETTSKKDKSEHREEALKKPHTKLEWIKTPENSNCPVVPPPLLCLPLILSSIYPSISICNFSPSLTIESLAVLPLTLERSLPSRVYSIYQSISAYTPSLYVCLSPSRVCARDHSRSRHLTRPLTPSSSASPSLTSIYQCTLVLRKLPTHAHTHALHPCVVAFSRARGLALSSIT